MALIVSVALTGSPPYTASTKRWARLRWWCHADQFVEPVRGADLGGRNQDDQGDRGVERATSAVGSATYNVGSGHARVLSSRRDLHLGAERDHYRCDGRRSHLLGHVLRRCVGSSGWKKDRSGDGLCYIHLGALAVDWCTQVAEIGAADLISADDQYLAVAKHRGSVAAPNPRHIRAHANDPLCSDLGESQISSWNPCPEASEDWLTWQLD